jgi:diadenosine tetraphosphate (Ap4A) HIT family hydrolase
MARINHDPYAGGHLFALVHHVTGLVGSEDEARATVLALEEAGVSTDDIDLFVGEQGAHCIDLFGREHGRFIHWLRRIETAMGDESEPNRRIDEALRAGATLLSVKVNHGPADEKARAFRVFKAHGHEIHYWGPFSFEDVQPDEPCAFCRLKPEKILGENEHMVWVFDRNPVSPGHSLVVSKRHVESFFDTTAAEREAFLSLLDQARVHVHQSHAPSGYNIGINEGADAGQSVQHFHVHLIPRFTGDTHDPRGGVRWVVRDRADYWSRS